MSNKCTLKKDVTVTTDTSGEVDEDGEPTEIFSGNKICAKTVIYHEDCECNFLDYNDGTVFSKFKIKRPRLKCGKFVKQWKMC